MMIDEVVTNILQIALGQAWEKCLSRWEVEQQVFAVVREERKACAEVADRWSAASIGPEAKEMCAGVAGVIRKRGGA